MFGCTGTAISERKKKSTTYLLNNCATQCTYFCCVRPEMVKYAILYTKREKNASSAMAYDSSKREARGEKHNYHSYCDCEGLGG